MFRFWDFLAPPIKLLRVNTLKFGKGQQELSAGWLKLSCHGQSTLSLGAANTELLVPCLSEEAINMVL